MGHIARRRTRFIVACTLVASIATIGLGGSAGAGKPAAGAPIKIGYIETFPGDSLNAVIIQALDVYVDNWNKRGGHNGQPIDIVYEVPSGFTPEAFTSVFNRLADEEDVVGFVNVGQCQLVLPALQAHQLPALGATTTCGADLPYMFSPGAAAPTLPMLKYAIDNGSKAFAVAYPAAVPQLKTGFVDPLNDYLDLNPQVDTTLVDVPMPFPATAADWDTAFETMKDAGVDALFAAVQPDGGVVAIEEARVQGFGPDDGITWIFGPNLYAPELATNPAFAGTYALSTNYPWEDTTNPQVKKMIKATKGKLDTYDGFAIGGYASGELLESSLEGLKGDVTSETLLADWKKIKKIALPLTPMTTAFKNLTKNPSGGVIMQFVDGGFVTASDFIVVPAKDFNP